MLKQITRPRETNFKLLMSVGTFLIGVSVLILVLGIIGSILSLLSMPDKAVFPLMSLAMLLYVIPLLVCGHLLHWFVAMWEARQESTRVLIELRKDLQHNKALKFAPSGPDA